MRVVVCVQYRSVLSAFGTQVPLHFQLTGQPIPVLSQVGRRFVSVSTGIPAPDASFSISVFAGRTQHMLPSGRVLYVRPLRVHSETVMEASSFVEHVAFAGKSMSATAFAQASDVGYFVDPGGTFPSVTDLHFLSFMIHIPIPPPPRKLVSNPFFNTRSHWSLLMVAVGVETHSKFCIS